jgi:MYXO-CTERM domain-containing protein
VGFVIDPHLYFGGDSTDPPANVTLNGTALLLRLDLQSIGGALGDTYQVEVVAGSPFNTVFDELGDPVDFEIVRAGTVTVTPEPGSLAIWGLAAVGGLLIRRRRR